MTKKWSKNRFLGGYPRGGPGTPSKGVPQDPEKVGGPGGGPQRSRGGTPPFGGVPWGGPKTGFLGPKMAKNRLFGRFFGVKKVTFWGGFLRVKNDVFGVFLGYA